MPNKCPVKIVFFPPSKKAAQTNRSNLRLPPPKQKWFTGIFFGPLYQHMGEVIFMRQGQFEWWACMQPDYDPPSLPQKKPSPWCDNRLPNIAWSKVLNF